MMSNVTMKNPPFVNALDLFLRLGGAKRQIGHFINNRVTRLNNHVQSSTQGCLNFYETKGMVLSFKYYCVPSLE